MLKESVFSIARSSLEANLETIGDKRYLTAGRNQFRSLWSRDFCYAARGLLALGHSDVVRDQLTLLLSFRRAGDSLIPRTLDSIAAQWRVVREVLARFLPWLRGPIPIGADLKPEYLGENGTEAIDSNLLVLLASIFYVEATGDQAWWARHEQELVETYRFYANRMQDGLVVQPGFSDWQDSARREGKAFLTNLLHWAVQIRLTTVPPFEIESEASASLREKIRAVFFDSASGVFLSMEGAPQVSLEGNLLAIDLGFVQGEEAVRLYAALRAHPLWSGGAGLPGYGTYPDYPSGEISPTAKWVGLRHYHDRIYWSWLLGLSLKVARRMNDEESTQKLLGVLGQALERDGSVVEVYFPEEGLPAWRSFWLDAERPFSWGAALIVEAVQTL